MTAVIHHPEPAAGATAIETIFEALLADIVRGTYPAGARLPAERELARILGASRPTLREALRRLGEWQLVEPRRGSGVVVRPLREWSIEVLPAYLRYAKPGPGQPSVARMLLDLLALRRAVFRDVIKLVAPRMQAGSTLPARAALARAWAARHNPSAFPHEDFSVIRAVAENAQFVPAVWMLNRLAGVYLEIAETVASSATIPEDYLESHTRLLDALDRGDGPAAEQAIADYLERHDRALTRTLEAFA
jgi:GntR family transcriptional regulator, transcriptional repressor for pyruvate dehydrogenase complex